MICAARSRERPAKRPRPVLRLGRLATSRGDTSVIRGKNSSSWYFRSTLDDASCCHLASQVSAVFVSTFKKTQIDNRTAQKLLVGKFCEGSSWNHFTSTPNSSQTNVVAEKAVRKTANSVDCHRCVQRNHDHLFDGRTRCERLCGMPFDGPIMNITLILQF